MALKAIMPLESEKSDPDQEVPPSVVIHKRRGKLRGGEVSQMNILLYKP